MDTKPFSAEHKQFRSIDLKKSSDKNRPKSIIVPVSSNIYGTLMASSSSAEAAKITFM